MPGTPTTLPSPVEDDAAPTTSWRRWVLATLLAVPLAAAYGAVVTVVGRALFLDDARADALRAAVDGLAPALLLWLAAAGTSLAAVAVLVREFLEARAAHRAGTETRFRATTDRSWAWPVIATGAPPLAIALAALVAGLVQLFQGGTSGESAVVFAALAGGWLVPIVALGWVLLVVRSGRDDAEPPPLEGIEDTWLQQAGALGFRDMILLGGVAALVAAVTGDRVDGSLLLAGLVLAAQSDFALRLWLLRRREERA